MYCFEELIIILFIEFFVIAYRYYKGQDLATAITEQVGTMYEKFAPYSLKVVREKTKELGQEYTAR